MTQAKLMVVMIIAGIFIAASLCAPLPQANAGGPSSIDTVEIHYNQVSVLGNNIWAVGDKVEDMVVTFTRSSDGEIFEFKGGYQSRSYGYEIAGYWIGGISVRTGFLPSTFKGTAQIGTTRGKSNVLSFEIDSPVCNSNIASTASLLGGNDSEWASSNFRTWFFTRSSTVRLFSSYVGKLTVDGVVAEPGKFVAVATSAVYECPGGIPEPLPAPHVQFLNPPHNFSMGGTTYTRPEDATLAINGIGDKFDLSLYSLAEARTIFTRTFTGPSSYDKTMCLFGNIPDGCNGWPVELLNGDYEFHAIAWQGSSTNTNLRRITIQIPSKTSCPPVTFKETPASGGATIVTVSGAWLLSVTANPRWESVSFDLTNRLIHLRFTALAGTVYVHEASYPGSKLCQSYTFGKVAPNPTVDPYPAPYPKPKTASNRTFVPWAQR